MRKDTRRFLRYTVFTAAAAMLLQATASAAAPRIVNGLTTHAFPTVGALLRGAGGVPIDADNAVAYCSGTLIGCRTFLTAAHCVADDGDPTHYWVYLHHVGIVPVSAIGHHPGYVPSLSGNDVAVVELATDVTGIQPTSINATHDLAALGAGLAGTIVGFGQTYPTARDFGIKRFGAIETVSCDLGLTGGEGDDVLVCWNFAIPVGPPGEDSTTCHGDSGGPLLMTFGGTTEVVGVTSAGSNPHCLPFEHAWEASVYHNAAWIAGAIGTDSTTACGGIGPVGDPAVGVTAYTGSLGEIGHASDTFTLELGGAPRVLRVALNGQNNGTFNPDLYVKRGLGAGPSSYDCKADGLSAYGACELPYPAPGTWSVAVWAAWGGGEYQVTSTVFAEPPLVCGNGVVEIGEECDEGVANGSAVSCCTASCDLRPDGDGDGVCDALDPCTNVAHAQDFVPMPPAKLTLGNIAADVTPGNDKLALRAAFALAGNTFATLDPLTRGARLMLRTRDGTTRLDVTLAAGAYAGKGTRGWMLNGPQTKWTFKDTTGSPGNGIAKVSIADRSRKVPREVAVAITGAKGTYPVVAGDEPVQAIVVLGNQDDALAGGCGESVFGAGDCTFKRAGETLVCTR
jgi:hypothetical protein